MMKRELPGYVIADSYEEFTAVAVEGANQSTAIIPAIVNNRAPSIVVGAVRWADVVGGAGANGTATTFTLDAYAVWDEDDTNHNDFRNNFYISQWAAPGVEYSISVGTDTDGSKPFFLCNSHGHYGSGVVVVTPFVRFRIGKSGNGTLTAGTIGIHWKMYGV